MPVKKSFVPIAFGLVLLLSGVAFPQLPDPRDSIILESKTVAPGGVYGSETDTASFLYVKVFITNKDSLTYMVLPLVATSTSGGAYAIVARPRSFLGFVSSLTNTLRYNAATSFARYNSNSPDTFAVAAGFDPGNPNPVSTIEPPNAARKAIWELKFDSIWAARGTFELDSSRVGSAQIFFSNTVPQDIKVNFVKSVITVAPKGDFNLDFTLTAADVTLILNCVFCSDCSPPPAGFLACDVNCDGVRSPADVVLELNAVFLYTPFPC